MAIDIAIVDAFAPPAARYGARCLCRLSHLILRWRRRCAIAAASYRHDH